MSAEAEHRVDVAVIGCGPAGSSAALKLAQAGVRTLLIGRATQATSGIGESLAPSATPLLRRLGLYSAFLETSPLPYFANRSSWGMAGRPLDREFLQSRDGHGWHIDRLKFDAMLLQQAREAGACHLTGSSFRTVVGVDAAGWRLRLALGSQAATVRARFVIDASGRTSAFAGRLGVPRRRLDRMVAAVAFLNPAGPAASDSSTLVEAAPCGWWYSAILPDGRMVAAFMTDADLPAARQARSDTGWLALVEATEHTRRRISDNGYRLHGTPRLVEAGNTFLTRPEGPGWLAAGDAAAAYDPLGSHGIGAALSGGARAAAAVQALLSGEAFAESHYGEQLARSYARYLLEWHAYYAQERRWPDLPFWSRRHPNY